MQKLKEHFRRPVRAVRAGMARRSVGRLRSSYVNGRETLVVPDQADDSGTEDTGTEDTGVIDLVALESEVGVEDDVDGVPSNVVSIR